MVKLNSGYLKATNVFGLLAIIPVAAYCGYRINGTPTFSTFLTCFGLSLLFTIFRMIAYHSLNIQSNRILCGYILGCENHRRHVSPYLSEGDYVVIPEHDTIKIYVYLGNDNYTQVTGSEIRKPNILMKGSMVG